MVALKPVTKSGSAEESAPDSVDIGHTRHLGVKLKPCPLQTGPDVETPSNGDLAYIRLQEGDHSRRPIQEQGRVNAQKLVVGLRKTQGPRVRGKVLDCYNKSTELTTML